jgi:fumarate hydratase class I
MEFRYQDPYPIQKDDTVYKKLTSDYVKVEKLGDREILTVDPKGLELLAEEAMADVSFMLRSSHLKALKESSMILKLRTMTDSLLITYYRMLLLL